MDFYIMLANQQKKKKKKKKKTHTFIRSVQILTANKRTLTKSDDQQKQMARKSQGNPCYQHTMMMMMKIEHLGKVISFEMAN